MAKKKHDEKYKNFIILTKGQQKQILHFTFQKNIYLQAGATFGNTITITNYIKLTSSSL